MYCKENLFQRVKGHIKESEIRLLESLVKDIDDFNIKYADKFVELYIDFDDVGTNNEWDTYETFSLMVKPKFESKKTHKRGSTINSGMSLDELDTGLCILDQYFEEKDGIIEELEAVLENDNKVLTDKIHELEKDNRLVYQDMDGIKAARIEDFTKQFLDGQLYDINRLPEVIYTLQNEDKSKFDRAWINDIALVKLLKYYYNKCGELEGKLKVAEDNAIMNQIMK